MLAVVASIRAAEPLTGAVFGPPFTYPDRVGDSWVNTWADDGQTYSITDDCTTSDKQSANLSIACLSGSQPMDLRWRTVNAMQEYGKNAEVFGSEKYCWKGNSILCVDGILYASISRHDYPFRSKRADKKQTSQDGSIIKSTDHGKTWTRSMQDNLARPMFPGSKFATLVFIQFGKNTSAKADGSDRYVYAISNDGYWNNGNSMSLGRVLRGKLSDLNGSDWQFYRGGDGASDSAWTNDVNAAEFLINETNKVGISTAAYVPQLGRYLMMQWHYLPNRWEGLSTWIWREAPSPWGPWKPFAQIEYGREEQYYNPCLLAKFTEDDGLRIWIAANGWYGNGTSSYCLKVFPVTLSTKRSLALSANHLQFATAKGLGDQTAQSLVVRRGNKAPENLEVETEPSATWLELKEQTNGNQINLLHHVKTDALPPGNYSTMIEVSDKSAQPERTRYTVGLSVHQLREPVALTNVEPGLRWDYYETEGIKSLPDLAKMIPKKSGVSPLPDLSVKEREEYFALSWQGYIKAATDGEYRFFIESEKGSQLFFGTNLLVDSKGPHGGNVETSGAVWLRAGLHPLRLVFFQSHGKSRLKLDELPPGESRRLVSATELFHSK